MMPPQRCLLPVLLLAGLGAAACGDDDRAEPTTGTEVAATSSGSVGTGLGGAGGAGPVGAGGDTSAGGSSGGGAGGSDARGWRTLPSLPSGPRQETAVVALDGEVWVMGGFDDAGNVLDTVEIFDPAAGSWRPGPPLPAPMHHANAVVVEGRLLLLGFLRDLSFEARGETFSWGADSGVWSPLAPLPRARGASAVGAIGESAIVCGGFRDGAVPDCDRYDTSVDTWEPLPDLPAIRDHVVGAVVDDRFFVVGGREGTIASIGGDVWELDLDALAFLPRRSMATPRAGCAAAVLDGRIFVAGGEGNPEEASGVFPQLEAYDPVEDTWSQLAPMPTPRHGTGAAVVDGMLVVPGGADIAAFSAVEVVEGFVP